MGLPDRGKGSGRDWPRYAAIGAALAVIAAGVPTSWVLAFRSSERAHLRRDAPAVLGASVSINSAIQGILDSAASGLNAEADPNALEFNRQIRDSENALKGLLTLVQAADRQGVAEARSELTSAIEANLDYLGHILALRSLPADQYDDEALGPIQDLAASAREGYSQVFAALRVQPDPYRGSDSTLLTPDALLQELADLQSLVTRWKEDYEQDTASLTTFGDQMDDLNARYEAIRGFSTTSIEQGLGDLCPPTYEYSNARSLLSDAYSERSILQSEALALARTAPRGLRQSAHTFANVLDTALQAIDAAQVAVDDYEYDQNFSPCYGYDVGYLYYSITEVPDWNRFQQLSGSIDGLLTTWEAEYRSALELETDRLDEQRQKLAAFGIEVERS